MRQRSMSRGASALCLALVCATALCASAEDELFEEHHAHEHGVATLEVALGASRLVLLFRSPAKPARRIAARSPTVKMARPMRLQSMYEPVWVIGKLSTQGVSSQLADAAYSIAGVRTEKYEDQ